MDEVRPPARKPAPARPDRPGGSSNRGVLGVVFVLALVLLAVYMLDRMTYWASVGDCAFTHAPQCRTLLNR